MNEKTTEQKILQAARQEFIKRGLGGARMQKIAESAGVNKAMLHYYFRSKAKLYEAALGEISFTIWSAVEVHLANLPASGTLRDLLRLVITTFFSIMTSNPDFPRMFIREIADGGQLIPVLAEKIIARFGTLPLQLNELIKKEIAQRIIYPIEPLHLFFNIMGMCFVSFAIKPIVSAASVKLGKPISFDDQFHEDRVNAILEMTYHGLLIQKSKP